MGSHAITFVRNSFCLFLQVFEGRRWSGMISVAPWEEASW